jgi:glycerophosphoryl diester phosphodiesterase
MGFNVGQRAPWLILHRASKSPVHFQRALASTADYLELDVWLEGGRVALRHDPLLRRDWPWLTRRHFIPVPRLRRFWLDQVRAPGRVFIDLKDSRAELVDRSLETLTAIASREGATVSTPNWEMLDRLETLAPDIGRFYSVGRGQRGGQAWAAYVQRIGAGRAGSGTSIHHETATAERLAYLNAHGLRAICYTVNDFDHGVALVEQGAGGLTSDRFDLVARWRSRWPQRS